MSLGVSSVVGKLSADSMATQIFASKATVFVLVTAPSDFCPICQDILAEFESTSIKQAKQSVTFLAADAFTNEFDDWISNDFPQLFTFVENRKEEGSGLHVKSMAELNRIVKK